MVRGKRWVWGEATGEHYVFGSEPPTLAESARMGHPELRAGFWRGLDFHMLLVDGLRRRAAAGILDDGGHLWLKLRRVFVRGNYLTWFPEATGVTAAGIGEKR